MIAQLLPGCFSTRGERSGPKRCRGEHSDAPPPAQVKPKSSCPGGGHLLLCDALLFHLFWSVQMGPEHYIGKVWTSLSSFWPGLTRESLPSEQLQTSGQTWPFGQASPLQPEATPRSAQMACLIPPCEGFNGKRFPKVPIAFR